MPILIEGQWTRRHCPEDRVVELVRHLVISPWVARVLVGRGIDTPEQARLFLHPESQPYHDPYPLPGLDAFLSRIESAIRNRERLILHGDYDADGVTSTAILNFALKRVGLEPAVFLPSRFEGGYGIQPDWVSWAKEEGFDLILATDCGSSAVEAAARAAELKIDLLISDHHTPDPNLEGPVAHINPHLPESRYPFKNLCAAGLALKLAQALTVLVPPSFQSQYKSDLPVDLAMVGTLADVMPLVNENRRIVVDGLDRVRMAPSPGLLALLQSARCDPAGVNAETIAFQVAPRLNAAGRLGSPQLAFDLLTETDPLKIQGFAVELEKINEKRKKFGKAATEQALARLEKEPAEHAVVLADAAWHRGVLGIVAAKVCEATGLPTFIAALEEGMAHGSARVPNGFSAVRLLEEACEHTERGGGHEGAAGFTVREECWEDFARAIRDSARRLEREPTPLDLEVDAFFAGDCDLFRLFTDISQLDPYGEGFPVPVFSVCRYESGGRHQTFGDNHLKITFGPRTNPIEAVGFGLGEWAKDLERKPVDVALEYGENHWNGRTSLRPKIVGIRPTLKEEAESGHCEEVESIQVEEAPCELIVWDARGRHPLLETDCLRVGYGPDWRKWWFKKVPGTLESWKERIWEKYSALPCGVWPGVCSVGYGGQPPEEWDGAVIEILWPPLRNEDRKWLAEVLFRESNSARLIRICYNREILEDWLRLTAGTAGRESLATVYRAVEKPLSLSEILKCGLAATETAVCLEVLLELGVLEWREDRIHRVPNPAKRNAEEAAFAKTWSSFHETLKTWLDRCATQSAGQLLRSWLRLN
jgi:single-stranded-DNA-specific exonuclease